MTFDSITGDRTTALYTKGIHVTMHIHIRKKRTKERKIHRLNIFINLNETKGITSVLSQQELKKMPGNYLQI